LMRKWLMLKEDFLIENQWEKIYSGCHHPILGDSPKFVFFPKKIKAGNAEKADQERLQK